MKLLDKFFTAELLLHLCSIRQGPFRQEQLQQLATSFCFDKNLVVALPSSSRVDKDQIVFSASAVC